MKENETAKETAYLGVKKSVEIWCQVVGKSSYGPWQRQPPD